VDLTTLYEMLEALQGMRLKVASNRDLAETLDHAIERVEAAIGQMKRKVN
jgi:hypothetical protein